MHNVDRKFAGQFAGAIALGLCAGCVLVGAFIALSNLTSGHISQVPKTVVDIAGIHCVANIKVVHYRLKRLNGDRVEYRLHENQPIEWAVSTNQPCEVEDES
jgi:hypothetical protein